VAAVQAVQLLLEQQAAQTRVVVVVQVVHLQQYMQVAQVVQAS
jgi:hypothetical protein